MSLQVHETRLPPLPIPILSFYVVSYLLDNPRYGIQSFSLLRGTIMRNQSFTNNISLYEWSKRNLNATKKTLTFFCTTTKVKVNWGKFVTIQASKQDICKWGQEEGLKCIPKCQLNIYYLGFLVGFKFQTSTNYDKVRLIT